MRLSLDRSVQNPEDLMMTEKYLIHTWFKCICPNSPAWMDRKFSSISTEPWKLCTWPWYLRETNDVLKLTTPRLSSRVKSFRRRMSGLCQCRGWCTERVWDDVTTTYPIDLAFCCFQGDCVSPGSWGQCGVSFLTDGTTFRSGAFFLTSVEGRRNGWEG
jgi:hypothetical protein